MVDKMRAGGSSEAGSEAERDTDRKVWRMPSVSAIDAEGAEGGSGTQDDGLGGYQS